MCIYSPGIIIPSDKRKIKISLLWLLHGLTSSLGWLHWHYVKRVSASLRYDSKCIYSFTWNHSCEVQSFRKIIPAKLNITNIFMVSIHTCRWSQEIPNLPEAHHVDIYICEILSKLERDLFISRRLLAHTHTHKHIVFQKKKGKRRIFSAVVLLCFHK